MNEGHRDRVVQYLYVHSPGDALEYPTSRAGVGPGRLASRYLECALVQAASLRFNEADCDLVLATNLEDRRLLGRYGASLLERLEAFGVSVLHVPYDHRPAKDVTWFYASRYVLDAIVACATGGPPEQRLWMMDLDCVWIDPRKVFAAFPPSGSVGCIQMSYDIDWDITGGTRAALEQLAPDRAAIGQLSAMDRGRVARWSPGGHVELGASLRANRPRRRESWTTAWERRSSY